MEKKKKKNRLKEKEIINKWMEIQKYVYPIAGRTKNYEREG